MIRFYIRRSLLCTRCFISFLLFLILSNYYVKAQTTNCTNSNFENGDFSNWQGATGTPNGNSGNVPGGCCSIVLNQFFNSAGLVPPRFGITTPILDPNTLNNLVEVCPNGGNFSGRLGALQNSFYAANNPGPFPGSKSEMIKYSFTVTPNSELFVYNYAVVLEDPKWNVTPHTAAQKPRFEIRVLDQAGNYVPNALCGHYIVVADSNNVGFHSGVTTSASIVHYKDWTTVGIDLTAYLNQLITIEFRVGDCALGGHFGYAYVDAYCGPLQVLQQYCVGQNQVALTAPAGFGYLWSPGGATTQNITVNNPIVGAVYTCQLTSVTGCVANISTIVQPTSIAPDFGYQVNCNLNTVLFLDSTVILNGIATNYQWNFGDGTPLLNGAQNNPLHTYPGPGVYNVTLTVSTVAGCSGVITQVVTIPSIVVDAPVSTLCSSSSVTINASGGTSYTWSPALGLNSSTGSSVQASPIISTTYTITAYNANGCSGTTTAVVNIAPNLVITLTASEDSICYGHSSIINAVGGVNYTWSPSTYLNSSTGSSVTSFPLANITYTVSSIDVNGCSGQASIPIVSVPNPVIAVSSEAICSGQFTTLYAFGVPTYNWSNGATGNSITVNPNVNTAYTVIGIFGSCTDTAIGNVIVSPLPIVTANSSGNICLTQNAILTSNGALTYSWSPTIGLSASTGSTVNSSPIINSTYSVIGTDLNGCSALASVPVTVFTPPVVSATPAFSVLCIGSNANLVAIGALTYTWSPSLGLSSSTGSSILANPTIPATYTVIGVDVNGCADTFAVDLYVSTGPAISIASSNSIICSGESAVLNASGASTYSWSPSNNLNTSTGSSVIASPIISTSYLVTALDSFGCVANSYSTVTVLPLPVISATSSGNLCVSGTVQLTALGGLSYQWSPSTGLSTTSGNIVNATVTVTTTYTVTGFASNGCSSSANVVVHVYPNPAISATPAFSILCTSSSANLTASGALSYSWSPSASLSSSSGSSVTATPNASTTFTLIGIDSVGCADTTLINIIVSPGPTLSINTGNSPICIGESTILNVSGAVSYTWSPSTSLNASFGSSVIASPTITTTYIVNAIDSTGCVANVSAVVIVNALPVVSIVQQTPILCDGSATALIAFGASSYIWSPTLGLSDSTGNVVTASPTITSTYSVTGTSSFGCVSTGSIIVTVFPNPILNLTSNIPEYCVGGAAILTATGAMNYLWSPSNNLSSSTGSIVNANPNSSTIFTIIGTDANGCTGVTNTSLIVHPLPVIVALSSSPYVCLNSSATLTATGAATYSWSPTIYLSSSTGSQVNTTPVLPVTYTVTGVDTNGCINDSSVSLFVHQLPLIFSSDTAMCFGFSSPLSVIGSSTYAWSPSTSLNTTSGSTVISTPTTSISYTILGTDINGCTGITTSVVTINPLPIIGVSSLSATFCNGQSTTITATGASNYAWSPSAGLGTTSGSTVIANPIASTTYSIIGIDSNGCQSSNTIPITVNQLPIVLASTGSPAVCLNSSTTLTVTGATSYVWSPAVNLSSSTGSSVVATPTSSTTYSVTGTDNNGCTATSVQNILVNTLPVINGTDTTLCLGYSTPLHSSGASTYAWSPSTSLNTTSGSTVISTPTTSISYTILGTDINGCTGITTSVVTINPLPIIGVSSLSATFCNGQSTTITATGASNYAWSPSAGLGTTSGSTVIANPIASTTYSIIGIDSNGCQSSNTIPITVNQLPIVSISSNTPSLCPGEFATLIASGALNYLWSTNALGSTIAVNPLFNTTYSVTGTDINGCTAMVATLVVINPVPVISAIAQQSIICFGQSTTITANGALNYIWSPSTGLSATTGSVVITNPTTSIVYTVIGTNISGCKDTTTVSLIVNPLPMAVTGNDENICIGSSAQLNASGGTTYLWFPSILLNSSTVSNPIATPIITTSFFVTVGNQYGCYDYDTVIVVVHFLPLVDAGLSKLVCFPDSINLIGSGANFYEWMPSTFLNDPLVQSPICSPSSDITYTLTGTDVFGCSSSDTVSVKVMKPFNIIASSDVTICYNDFVQLNATGGNNYTWTPINGLDNPYIPNPIALPSITTSYIVFSTDGICFNSSDTVVVTVNPLPQIYAGADVEILYGQTYQLNAYTNGGTIQWEPPTFLNCTTCQFPIASHVDIPITYLLTVTDSFGCKAEDYIKINLACAEDLVYLPDAFTPNGDNKNDVFRIRTYGLSEVKAFRVFNRWGELVFETYDVNEGWDGKWQGQLCHPAVYVWYIQGTCANGVELLKKGNVTLIR